jgi:flagellar biosynthesis anti-sigma factor FlgM
MRIDSNLPLSHAPESGRSTEANKKGRVNLPPQFLSPADEAKLSGATDQVSALHAELAKVPDVRQDKVNALADALHQGTWKANAEDIAQAMFADLLGHARR